MMSCTFSTISHIFQHPFLQRSDRSSFAAVHTARRFSTASQPPLTPQSRFSPYRQALNTLAERTRTPISSLIVSFAVLHELTAILPFTGFFFLARTFDVGNRLFAAFPEQAESVLESPDPASSAEVGWMVARGRESVVEGMRWAEHVGRRYGIFGFESSKNTDGASVAVNAEDGRDVWGTWVSERAAGDFVNAVIAYGITKMMLPVRIGLSLYLSPAFSRRVVEPTRMTVVQMFRRRPPA
ncbi:uncharacterized protein LAESUDRAFT_728640 [Laetiporus sulphureus 93-53]|uniref:Uncharacterized protein n=1 Tax=Laetiporus sulphureus 93-53 TaxID=1314785 RepID=A0A165D192_9APHY|nr:uncharacterized protein LAESUDRAFT_728640 [Laetiporus sulphureus 93-53]KZT03939.1 hypothetical protein LAESUDRAFT_728640 [Laetiporus sulphureus 93-53]